MENLARKICNNTLKMYSVLSKIPPISKSKRGYFETVLGYIKDRNQYVDAVNMLNDPIVTEISKEHLKIYDSDPKAYTDYIHSIGIY